MKIKIRKRDEVKKLLEKRERDFEAQSILNDTWVRHWERESDSSETSIKRLGGNKRPNIFKTK